MWNSSIWHIDRILSGTTTPGQSGPWSDGSDGLLSIPQSSSITEASPSDCLVSNPGHSLGAGVLPLCMDAVSLFYSPSQLSLTNLEALHQTICLLLEHKYDNLFPIIDTDNY